MEPEDEPLSPELLEWIARTVGGRVVQVRRQARWRANYFVDVDAPGLETVVLKSARAPRHVIERSALLSTFNSHREAVMLELLQDQDVKVPPYLGFHDDSRSLLMAKVEGSAQVHGLEDREQMRRISRDFAEQLASLHRLAVDDLDLTDDLRIPTTPRNSRSATSCSTPRPTSTRCSVAVPTSPIRCSRSPVPGSADVSLRSIGRRRWSRAIADPTSSSSPAIA